MYSGQNGNSTTGWQVTCGWGRKEPAVDASQTPTAVAGKTRGRSRITRPGGGTPTRETRVTGRVSVPELVLGRYRLVKPLGSGAFGAVYAGRDERLDRDVAIKVLARERVVGGRFEREARAAARLSHPAIVTLFEAAVDDDGAYLVSELVRGRTLDEVLGSGKLSDRDILNIAVSLCQALEHAHDQGVIHRDVKPSNVLIPARPASSGHPAKLTDFGIARIVGGDALTRTGDVVGTLAYMAPEQAEGRECGPAADLYALAVVIYEALTGANPLRQLRVTTRTRRLGTYLPPLRRQRRDLPRALGAAIDQALRPRPSERGEVRELRQALVACLEVVGDVRGVVVPGWHGQEEDEQAGDEELGPEWREPAGGSDRAVGPQADSAGAAALIDTSPARGAAAVAAALVAGWTATHLLTSSPVAPVALGLVAASAVLVAPRLGWVLTIGVVSGMAAAQGHSGGALLLAIVALVSACLLIPVSRLWSMPALAGALGVIGLGAAWPGLAGRSGLRVWQRALLGGAGFLWLAAADPFSSPRLFGTVAHLPPGTVWTGSVAVTLDHVITPILGSGVLAAAAVWAVGAAMAPWLVSRTRPLLSLVAVTIWSAVLVAAVQSLGPKHLTGAVIGALVGALVLLGPAWPALFSTARDRAGLLTRVP